MVTTAGFGRRRLDGLHETLLMLRPRDSPKIEPTRIAATQISTSFRLVTPLREHEYAFDQSHIRMAKPWLSVHKNIIFPIDNGSRTGQADRNAPANSCLKTKNTQSSPFPLAGFGMCS